MGSKLDKGFRPVAMQRVLMFSGNVQDLRHFGLRHLVRINAVLMRSSGMVLSSNSDVLSSKELDALATSKEKKTACKG